MTAIKVERLPVLNKEMAQASVTKGYLAVNKSVIKKKNSKLMNSNLVSQGSERPERPGSA